MRLRATIKRKRIVWAVALGLAAVLVTAQLAGALHPRPKSATPVRVALVPAYEECTSPNREHGPPLAFPSCSPPVQSSQYLTIGSPDVTWTGANSVGVIKLRVVGGQPSPPDDAAVEITGSISDVRCKPGVSACGNANAAGGPDYTGELQGNATIRITDHNNAVEPGGGTDAATVVDFPFPFNLQCVSTSSTGIGGTCTVAPQTCLGCFPPPIEGFRTLVGVSQMQVRDGGADGVVATDDNTLFAVQGIFAP